MIRVLFFPVGERPREHMISGDLESMQKLVGGWIQMVPIGKGMDLVCDEEGKINGAMPNRFISSLDDMVCGPFFITKSNEDGDCVSLTDSDIMKAVVLCS